MKSDHYEQTLTIRQMCDLFRVTPRTLRFYEAKGLLTPLRRKMRRFFTQSDVARMKIIADMKQFGFNLESIGQSLARWDGSGTDWTTADEAEKLALARIAELEASRAEIGRQIETLEERVANRSVNRHVMGEARATQAG